MSHRELDPNCPACRMHAEANGIRLDPESRPHPPAPTSATDGFEEWFKWQSANVPFFEAIIGLSQLKRKLRVAYRAGQAPQAPLLAQARADADSLHAANEALLRQLEVVKSENSTPLWECPDCAFAFHASHSQADGSYSCPNCAAEKLRERVIAAADAATKGQYIGERRAEDLRAALAEYQAEKGKQ